MILDDHGFLNCSCGRTNEYLLPCVHICRVVNNEEFFGPSQFHVRWYKDFCHYYDTDFGNEFFPEKEKLLKEILVETRRNHYNVLGEYRGCFLGSEQVIAKIFDDSRKYVLNESKKNMLWRHIQKI